MKDIADKMANQGGIQSTKIVIFDPEAPKLTQKAAKVGGLMEDPTIFDVVVTW